MEMFAGLVDRAEKTRGTKKSPANKIAATIAVAKGVGEGRASHLSLASAATNAKTAQPASSSDETTTHSRVIRDS
jgi:hypothetical protein